MGSVKRQQDTGGYISLGRVGRWEVGYSPSMLMLALALFIVGLLTPYVFASGSAYVLSLIRESMEQRDTGLLLESAILLTFVNSLRSMPNYFCILAISRAFSFSRRGKRSVLMAAALMLPSFLVIRLVYSLIFYVHAIEYGLGVHSVVIILFIMYLYTQDTGAIKARVLVIAMILFVTGVQFLDIVPALTVYGMGKGELSTYVKNAALLADSSRIITMFATTVFFVFIFSTFLIIRLMVDEHKLLEAHKKEESLVAQVYLSRLKALEMRSLQEIQSLVHDLKAPLTSIQGLAKLSEMTTSDARLLEYQQRISASVDKMNEMVSSILYSDKKHTITMEDLLRQVFTNIEEEDGDTLRYTNRCPDAVVRVNQVRMVRALVNVIQNAKTAIEGKQNGLIEVEVEGEEEQVRIAVRDNGKGIAPESLSKIWDIGYSGNFSTGLGLNFVRSVVENDGGTVAIRSEQGEYTVVVVSLRREDEWKREST